MIAPWRPLALAAAIHVTAVVGAATAQTVMVTHAPPGSTIEVAINTALLGTVTADAQGRATVPMGAAVLGAKAFLNVRLYVDTCDTTRRVVLVEPGVQPLAAGACGRQDIAGVYRLLPVSTFVVDLGPSPFVRLRQGPAPAEWFLEESERATRAARPDVTPRAGMMLFGGGAVASFKDAVTVACGNVPDCSGGTLKAAGTAGATIWATKWLALEGSYLKPMSVKASGKATDYTFDDSLGLHVATAAVKIGFPAARVRPYAVGGMTYHWSTSSMAQTINDTTVTVDNVTTTIPGGAQTFELKTRGWGWMAGVGMEVPVSRLWTIYTEASRFALKGDDVDGGEGRLNERLFVFVVGVQIRLGR